VFTVMPSNGSYVDVRFSAHGSPYYAPEKLNNKATQQQEKVKIHIYLPRQKKKNNEILVGE
jgi:hypothetical protein